MSDLYLGVAIMAVLAAVAFALTLLFTRKAPMWVVDGLAALVVVGIAVYARYLWDDTYVAKLLPYSNLIIVSNWFPIAAAILAGLVWRRIGNTPAKFLGLGRGEYGSTPRKLLAATVLFGAGMLSSAWPIFGTPPECGNDWQGDICLQTTEATCSPAAGATLLQSYGVYASEQEMADLCLTRRGTTWKGLYRALSIKGETVGLRVEVANRTADELTANFTDPCILQCELLLNGDRDELTYQMEGWVPGQPHSVVLLDVIHSKELGDHYLVADPTAFAEVWSRDNLVKLWHGQTLGLVPMDGPATDRND